MKINTKLTLLIGGGMMLLSVIFLITGTIFSIHETLLIKRHDLKVAARRIDLLMQTTTKIDQFQHDINNGLLFLGKKENLKATIFCPKGDSFLVLNNDKSTIYDENNYPDETGDYNQNVHWVSWNHWEIDFYYRGSSCWIQMNLRQKLEIQEDMASFFFGSLLISIILSFVGGRLITSRILKRASKIESAAQEIASGNLNYRIDSSETNDEIRGVENNLNTAFSELQESFNKIIEFSSDIAHELRTPLTIITGEIEVALRQTRDSSEYQKIMSNILDEVVLLRRIIDDMLILVKPESAYKQLEFETVNISIMINDTIALYESIADSKNIQFKIEIETDVVVKGVESLISLIFSNLIYNALKFTHEKGKISIKLDSDKTSAIFSVSDNGPGIPDEEQKKIFSRFYRMKQNQKKGTGLGLAIVKKVCDINNAAIKLQSIEGEGSTFAVTFPLSL